MDVAAGAVVVLCWGCTPLLKKKLTGNLTVHELTILNHMAVTFILVIMALYLISSGSLNVQNYKNLGKTEYLYLALVAVATVVSSICLIHLLKKREASTVMALIQPLAILTTVVVGVVLAAEGVSKRKVSGCVLVCAGVVLLALS